VVNKETRGRRAWVGVDAHRLGREAFEREIGLASQAEVYDAEMTRLLRASQESMWIATEHNIHHIQFFTNNIDDVYAA
jgi:hypothetical protein